MDFSYLLELAKSNDNSNKQEASVSRFSTKVSRPKKEIRPGPKVAAVKAVIDRLTSEKVKENEEARKKKENLLTLRAQDRKSNKRVRAMINMNKGASKAVMDDAKDISTAKGEEQCDEDDYGYESNMSQQIFSKLANQYASMPEDDKLKFVRNNKKGTIDDIKSRVINNLKRVEEEEMGPRRRKRKKHHADAGDEFINDGDEYAGTALAYDRPHKEKEGKSSHKMPVNINLTNYKSDKYSNFKYGQDQTPKDNKDNKDNPEKERPKKAREKVKAKAAPPPMSFEELLKVAQKKHQEAPLPPPKEEVRPGKEKDKKKEPDRPLTAKEKEELEEERRRKLRRMGKLPPEKKPSEAEAEADKLKKGEKGGKKGPAESDGSASGPKLKKALEAPKTPEPKAIDRSKYFAVPFSQKPKEMPPPAKESRPPQTARPFPPPRPQPPPRPEAPPRPEPSPKEARKPFGPPGRGAPPSRPPSKPMPKGRPGPPPPGLHKRPPRPPSPPGKRRIESDSEEEYDSEMDDFIDDGEDEVDVSSEIKRMFGYDRSRYQDDDDDVDDMEASFSQMQKEERISARIGLQEDLEDIKREEEEKKRKMQRFKQAKKGRR